MKSFFNQVMHPRNDVNHSSVRAIPQAFRLTPKDTLKMQRCQRFRRAVPKPILPLTYTPPHTNHPNSHVNKDELLNSDPSNSLRESVLPLMNLQQSLTSHQLSVQSCTDEMMALFFRFFPERTRYKRYHFIITEEANKMLKHVFTSLGLSKMVRFSTKDLFLNTRVRGGLHHLLPQDIASVKKVIEFLTYYKGQYGRLIILVSLGVGCTVWYNFLPGVPEAAPLGFLVPTELPYDSFNNVDFHIDSFKKMSFVEYKYITDQVLSALENIYPFTEIDLAGSNPESSNPESSNPNVRVAIGLGLIVAVFLVMGMTSSSSEQLIEKTL